MLLSNDGHYSTTGMLAQMDEKSDSDNMVCSTEEEIMIITDKDEIVERLNEKFAETKFDLKHLATIVNDLEKRIQSLYDNCLYIMLAQ